MQYESIDRKAFIDLLLSGPIEAAACRCRLDVVE